MLFEETARFVDRQVEQLADITALQADREDVTLETTAIARIAFYFQVRHEMHFDCRWSFN